MATIFLKGNIQHVISDFDAEEVKRKWKDGYTGIFEFNDITFKANEIKSVLIGGENQKVKENKWKKYDEDFKKWQSSFRILSPELKSEKKFSFMNLLFCLAKKDILQSWDEVKSRLNKFFSENPRRCFPDFKLFDDLLDDYKFNLNLIEKSAFDALVKTVNNDIYSAK